MRIEIIIDDDAIERIVRRVLAERETREEPEAPTNQGWLVNCARPADLFRLVEAPDTSMPGMRAEPHWLMLQRVRAGDVLVFRDMRRRAIVGHAMAQRAERGPHRQQAGVPALRWHASDAVEYDPPLPDAAFIRIFEAHQTSTPGFPLLRSNGHFAQKANLYPLDEAVLAAIRGAVRGSSAGP
jgi:hypothetical protein